MVDIPKCASDFQVSGIRFLNKTLLQFCSLTLYLLQICVSIVIIVMVMVIVRVK